MGRFGFMKNTLYTKFANKQVIDSKNGRILGYTVDLNFDAECALISSFFVRESGRFCLRPKDRTIEIPWNKITKIGDDVIIADIDFCPPRYDKKEKKRAECSLF